MRTSILKAIRSACRRAPDVHKSIWRTDILPKKGKARRGKWRVNLTTTTAASYVNAYDWLAAAMANGPGSAFATAAAWAVAGITITGTTLTAPTGFPTSGNGLAGQIVVAFGLTSQTIRWGYITSNTATVLTVDQWYDVTSTSGAVGATPTTSGGSASTGVGYIVLPGQAPAPWMCVSASVFTPATSDQSLNTQGAELTSSTGFARAVGTWAHSHAASTYTQVHLWTASGAGATINNEGISGAATILTTPNFGGVFPFESAEPSPPTLVSGDTLQNTVTITI